MRTALEFLLAAASGAVLALPFVGGPAWPIWFALAPMLHLVAAASSARRAAALAAVFALAWVLPPLAFIVCQTWLGYLLASGYTASWYVAGLLVARVLARRSLSAAVFGVAALWTLIELARACVPVLGFPWLLLGHAAGDWPTLRQAADLAGVYGLSFLLVLVNTMLAYVAAPVCCAPLPGPPGSPRARGVCGLIVLGLILATLVYGGGRVAELAPRLVQGPPLALIQGCEYQKVGRTEEDCWAQLRAHLRWHQQAVAGAPGGERPALVCWAETMAPGRFGVDAYGDELRKTVGQAGVPTVFGTDFADPRDAGLPFRSQRWFNSGFVLDRDGRTLGQYAKRKLVPFGEYVPWKEWLPFVDRLKAITRDNYTPGQRASPAIAVAGLRLALNICIEDTHPDVARDAVRAGADVLVNLTNDGWFRGSCGPVAHLQAARLRAVETRRPLLRVTNSGVSAQVDPLGEVEVAIAPETPGIGRLRLRRLAAPPEATWAVALGDGGAALLWALLLSVSFLAGVARPKA